MTRLRECDQAECQRDQDEGRLGNSVHAPIRQAGVKHYWRFKPERGKTLEKILQIPTTAGGDHKHISPEHCLQI